MERKSLTPKQRAARITLTILGCTGLLTAVSACNKQETNNNCYQVARRSFTDDDGDTVKKGERVVTEYHRQPNGGSTGPIIIEAITSLETGQTVERIEPFFSGVDTICP